MYLYTPKKDILREIRRCKEKYTARFEADLFERLLNDTYKPNIPTGIKPTVSQVWHSWKNSSFYSKERRTDIPMKNGILLDISFFDEVKVS